MTPALSLARLIDKLNDKVGTIVGWLTTTLVLVVCYDVFTRYFLRQSSIAVQELEWHLFSVIFLLGAGFTLRHDRHVRVDVLYINFSRRKKAWINFLGSLFFLLPFSILVIATSKTFIVNSFLLSEKSADPGGLPARYALKAFIAIGFLFVLLQGISLLIHSLATIMDRGPAHGRPND